MRGCCHCSCGRRAARLTDGGRAQLRDLRASLQRAAAGGEGAALFTALYCSWCHSVGAVLSLCFLAQARTRFYFAFRLTQRSDISVFVHCHF